VGQIDRRLAGATDVDGAAGGLSHLIEPPRLASHRAEIDLTFHSSRGSVLAAPMRKNGVGAGDCIPRSGEISDSPQGHGSGSFARTSLDFDACMRMEFSIVNDHPGPYFSKAFRADDHHKMDV